MTTDPVFVPMSSYGVGRCRSMAVRPDGARVYLGRDFTEDHRRENLVVLPLDPATGESGEPRSYSDSTESLPPGAHATVPILRLSPDQRTLYLSNWIRSRRMPEAPENYPATLTCRQLDGAGDPVPGGTSSLRSGRYWRIHGLAAHPKLPLLYLSGQAISGVGVPGLTVVRLDPSGVPVEELDAFTTGLGGHALYSPAVAPDGKRLYLGAHPRLVKVVALGADGLPTGEVADVPAPGAVDVSSHLLFSYTPQALYDLRDKRELGTLSQSPPRDLLAWPLEPGTGLPSESGVPYHNPEVRARSVAPDPDRSALWACRDLTFTHRPTGDDTEEPGEPRFAGTELLRFDLDPDGLPAGPGTVAGSAYGEEALVVEVTGAGVPVVLTRRRAPDEGNQVVGHHLRVTVEDLVPPAGEPSPGPDDEIWVWVNRGRNVPAGHTHPARLGEPVTLELDRVLAGRSGDVTIGVGVGRSAGAYAGCTLRIGYYSGNPDQDPSLAPLATLTDTTASNVVLFLAPGYGATDPADRAERIRLLSTHAARYLATAQAVAVAGADRPRRFTVSAYSLLGGQGHLGQFRDCVAALAALGFNTVGWKTWPGMAPELIERELAGAGLTGRLEASYAPLHAVAGHAPVLDTGDGPLVYFDFHLGAVEVVGDDGTVQNLQTWASDALQVVEDHSGTVDNLVEFMVADEPGWIYPDVLERLDGYQWRDAFTAAFQQYLREHRVALADPEPFFDAGTDDRQERIRHYWTARFFADQAALGQRRVAQALQAAYAERTGRRTLPVWANWNNFYNRWGKSCPERGRAGRPDATGVGGPDWFTTGRLDGNLLWSEDWGYSTQRIQRVSAYADVLRCAAMQGGQPFGFHVVGQTLNAPAAASYRVMALVGKGAKSISYYTFGPELLFPGNCWSESFASYGSIADANRLLGRAEHLLYPGRPVRGNVAIVLPGTSQAWEPGGWVRRLYENEVTALHFALVHAGYTVDFVDDFDVRDGALTERGYRVVYLVGPNLRADALDALASWVRRGGTLAVTPGAGTLDEYREPSTVLDGVLGHQRRDPDREKFPGGTDPADELADTLVPVPERPVGLPACAEPLWLRAPAVPLQPEDPGDVVARFGGGDAAVTRHRHGRGTAIGYGFYPGFQYWLTPTIRMETILPDLPDRRRLPAGWGRAQRRLAVWPVVQAGAPKLVELSHELVEACRLESDAGLAVVLLNWSDQPIDALRVTIDQPPTDARVASARGAPACTYRGLDSVTVELPLAHTDVLMFEREER